MYPLPRTSSRVSFTAKSACPLKVPCFFEFTTVPVTCAPLGMATSLSTLMSSATLPVNSSPGLATRELMVLDKITGIEVPAGTTKGFGGSGGGVGCCAVVDCPEPCCPLSVDGLLEEPFLLQPAAIPSTAVNPNSAHFLFMVSPTFQVFVFSSDAAKVFEFPGFPLGVAALNSSNTIISF